MNLSAVLTLIKRLLNLAPTLQKSESCQTMSASACVASTAESSAPETSEPEPVPMPKPTSKTCRESGKVIHSKGEAAAHLRALKKQKPEYDGRVYPCCWCQAWHVGRLKLTARG